MNGEEHVTARIKVDFKLNDYRTSEDNMHYWISMRPVDRHNFPFEGWVGLDLPDGISYDRAKEIRDYLEEVVVDLVHWT